MSALEALTVARKHGIKLILDGDDIIVRTKGPPPADVLAILRAAKPDLVRRLKREAVAGVDLVEAIASYFASRRWWRGPPGALFTVVGHPFDEGEDEAVLVNVLAGTKNALAERSIVMEVANGYVTLTRPEPSLAERIVA
jgi:hypothetical protein